MREVFNSDQSQTIIPNQLLCPRGKNEVVDLIHPETEHQFAPFSEGSGYPSFL